MRKKLLAILFVVMMMASMSVSVFAAEVTEDQGKQEVPVNATYQDSVTTIHKISVNVSWEAMEFTYSTGGTKTWDEKSHTYKDNATAGWSDNGKTVTVTNHSDSAIKVEFEFKADAAYNTVTGRFDNESINLPSAVGKSTTASELTGTSKLTLDGTLSSSVTTSTKVGTITVEVTRVDESD